MFAPSLILPYSLTVVPLDKAGASLTTFISMLLVEFCPALTPIVCSLALGEQSETVSPCE